LRFAGYNPLHYIPYRTYNWIVKATYQKRKSHQNKPDSIDRVNSGGVTNNDRSYEGQELGEIADARVFGNSERSPFPKSMAVIKNCRWIYPIGIICRNKWVRTYAHIPGFSEKSSLCRGTASRKCSLVKNISPAVPLRSKLYCYRASDRSPARKKNIFVSPVSTNIITLPQQPIITHFLHKLIFGVLHKTLGV
jgi:hypothetical protein